MKNESIRRGKAPANKRRRFCIFLALMMIVGAVMPALPVAAAGAADAAAQSRIDEVKEILNAIPYQEYLKANSKMPMGSGEIIIKPKESKDGSNGYSKEFTLAEEAKIVAQGGSPFTDKIKFLDKSNKYLEKERQDEFFDREAIYIPDEGLVVFNFTVPPGKGGLYNLAVTYQQVMGKRSSIERLIKIGDIDNETGALGSNKVPFKEARYITLTKRYVDDFAEYSRITKEPLFKEANGKKIFEFERDIKDNEIKPPKTESPEWKEILTEDSSGFVEEPFLYYLTEGRHTLTLEAVREAAYISEIKFFVADPVPTYDEYRARRQAADREGRAVIDGQISLLEGYGT